MHPALPETVTRSSRDIIVLRSLARMLGFNKHVHLSIQLKFMFSIVIVTCSESLKWELRTFRWTVKLWLSLRAPVPPSVTGPVHSRSVPLHPTSVDGLAHSRSLHSVNALHAYMPTQVCALRWPYPAEFNQCNCIQLSATTCIQPTSRNSTVGMGFGPMACVAFGLMLRAWSRWLAVPMGRHQLPCRRVGPALAVMPGIGLRMWYSASQSMLSPFAYIFLYVSLSLLFRQSLLYDSQFNISIRTRLISTSTILWKFLKVPRAFRLSATFHTLLLRMVFRALSGLKIFTSSGVFCTLWQRPSPLFASIESIPRAT